MLVFVPFIGLAQEQLNGESDSILIVNEEYHHCTFKKNSISIGVGAVYSFNIETVGVNARFYYNIGEKVCFGPEFSYFKNGVESIVDVDFVIHYIFETKLVGIYPLVGVNYTTETRIHHTQDAYGVVFGAGLHRNFKMIGFFAEYAHVESNLRDDFITLGMFLNIR